MDDLLSYTTELQPSLVRLVVSLGLGFLIGLEREYAKHVVDKEEQFAGVRTYTLIALFGFIASFLTERYGEWLFLASLLGFVAMVIASYVLTARTGGYGITTELSAILTFLLGALVYQGHILFAVIVTVVITTLLTLKIPLHRFVHTLTPQEIRAFIQFVVISAVVLPFLPDQPFGPYGVWNLKDIWTMVILVAGVSLAGYLLAKTMGQRKGTLLAGIVGGLVSSTAVTLNFARRSLEKGSVPPMVASVGIISASAIMLPRILFEAWVLNPALGTQLILPVLFITACGLLMAYRLHRRAEGSPGTVLPLENPLNFRVAIQFALAYMAVQWLVAFAFERYGQQGIYWAGMLSGTTDMDAITLSMARMAKDPETRTRAAITILLATLSNTLVKYLIVVIIGDRSLRKPVSIGFGAMFIAGVLGILGSVLI